MVDVPFEYTCIMAFKTLLQYEKKRKLTLKQLINYRDVLFCNVIDNYESDNYKYPDDNFPRGFCFSKIDTEKEFRYFLNNYGDCFYYDGEYVYLNDNIDVDILSEMLADGNVSSRILDTYDCIDCLDAVGAYRIVNFLDDFIVIEKEIQDDYRLLRNNDSVELRKKIALGLIKRNVIIENMYRLNVDDAYLFTRTIENIIYCMEDYDYFRFPIDVIHYCETRENNSIISLNDLLYNASQFAYFGNNDVAIGVVSDIFQKIYNDKTLVSDDDSEYNFDDGVVVDSEWKEEEFIFYINLIKNIDIFMKNYFENDKLIEAKYRLMYTLDSIYYQLYDGNIQNMLMISDKYMSENDICFDYFMEEAEYFIYEVFNNDISKILTIKKLLIIRTYYELSLDEKIVELFDKYVDHEKYKEYREIVFENKRKNKTKTKLN